MSLNNVATRSGRVIPQNMESVTSDVIHNYIAHENDLIWSYIKFNLICVMTP